MSINFNANEILEMAEGMEVNGAAFYRKAAEGAGDDDTRRQLEELATMEDGHLATFTAVRESLSLDEKAEPVWDPEGLAAGYLRAFVDGHVFDVKADPSKALTGRESPEEIFRVAIGLERDSIAFYLGLKELVPESLGRDKVEGIIKEEMGHIRLLSGKVAAL